MTGNRVPHRIHALAKLLLLVLFAAARLAHAQIGTPIDIGSNQSGGVGTALTITTSQAVPQGSSILVIAVATPVLGTPPTSAICSDTAFNTYNTDVTRGDINSLTTICSSHPIAAQLPQGATITVTWSGGVAPFIAGVRAFFVTGLANPPLDKTASARGSSTSPSSGATATTTQPDELLFGVITDEFSTVANSGFTPGTNGTSNPCAATGTSTYTSLGGINTPSGPSLFGMHCVVSASGTYAAQATINSSLWEALVATYMAAPFSNTALAANANPVTAGQPVTFTATVTGHDGAAPPTGNVTFKDGATVLGTGALNGGGVATFATSSLSVGVHSITAVYGGDTTFPGSTSSPLNEVINPLTALTVTANPTSLSLASGQSGQVALTITGNGSSPVTVNCIPVTVTCSVSTPVVGTSSTTATLTINTVTTFAGNRPPASPRSGQLALVLFGTVMPFGMLIIPICRRNRSKLHGRKAIQAGLGLLLLIIIFSFSIGGCGGNARPGAPVLPGSYSVAVAAASGSLSGGTSVSVTVH